MPLKVAFCEELMVNPSEPFVFKITAPASTASTNRLPVPLCAITEAVLAPPLYLINLRP